MLKLTQLKLDIEYTEEMLRQAICRALHIPPAQLGEVRVLKRSLDARAGREPSYSLQVAVSLIGAGAERRALSRGKNGAVSLYREQTYSYSPSGTERLRGRIVVVGAGPAGLFCAYFLAKHGYRPLLLERGAPVELRTEAVRQFWETGVLQPESNVQFGEGGAGTFSDGKLNTMVKDPNGRLDEILRLFHAYGAPEDILYVNKPHIGTDVLTGVVRRLREAICAFGGEVRFGARVTGLCVETAAEGGRCLTGLHVQTVEESRRLTGLHNQTAECGVQTELVACSAAVFAIGHSARDTAAMLYRSGVSMEPKAFAVGLRIEHSQAFLNRAQYGAAAERLPAADYKLTHKGADGRGVYSFCMCPGGYVVNASSEAGFLAVNGMSDRARDGVNANSALVVTVRPEDFAADRAGEADAARTAFGSAANAEADRAGEADAARTAFGSAANVEADRAGEADAARTAFGSAANAEVDRVGESFLLDGIWKPEDGEVPAALQGIVFQRKYERRAFLAGGGRIPVQRYADFVAGCKSETLGAILPQTKGAYALANLRDCLPKFAVQALIDGMKAFDRQLAGFANPDAVLSGVETRTSSPVRILRDDGYESNIKGLYPCGEGAGYAGGIMSSAADGMKVFEAITARYAKPESELS